MTHEVVLHGYNVKPGSLQLGTFDSYGIEKIHVTADDEWAGLDILGVFHAPDGTATKVVVGADGMLAVPPEATAKQAGVGRIVFVGLAENVQRITVDMGYSTKPHSDIEGDNPGTPTPDVVQRPPRRAPRMRQHPAIARRARQRSPHPSPVRLLRMPKQLRPHRAAPKMLLRQPLMQRVSLDKLLARPAVPLRLPAPVLTMPHRVQRRLKLPRRKQKTQQKRRLKQKQARKTPCEMLKQQKMPQVAMPMLRQKKLQQQRNPRTALLIARRRLKRARKMPTTLPTTSRILWHKFPRTRRRLVS